MSLLSKTLTRNQVVETLLDDMHLSLSLPGAGERIATEDDALKGFTCAFGRNNDLKRLAPNLAKRIEAALSYDADTDGFAYDLDALEALVSEVEALETEDPTSGCGDHVFTDRYAFNWHNGFLRKAVFQGMLPYAKAILLYETETGEALKRFA